MACRRRVAHHEVGPLTHLAHSKEKERGRFPTSLNCPLPFSGGRINLVSLDSPSFCPMNERPADGHGQCRVEVGIEWRAKERAV